MIQQGDVLFKRVEGIPEGEKVRVVESGVVMDGEVTGHAHRINTGDYELKEIDGVLFLKAITDVEITHEEHGAVVLTPGQYQIDQVREYDHFKEEERKVVD